VPTLPTTTITATPEVYHSAAATTRHTAATAAAPSPPHHHRRTNTATTAQYFMHVESGVEQAAYPDSEPDGGLGAPAQAYTAPPAAPTITPNPTFTPAHYLVEQAATVRDGPDIDASSVIAELEEGRYEEGMPDSLQPDVQNPHPTPQTVPHPTRHTPYPTPQISNPKSQNNQAQSSRLTSRCS